MNTTCSGLLHYKPRIPNLDRYPDVFSRISCAMPLAKYYIGVSKIISPSKLLTMPV